MDRSACIFSHGPSTSDVIEAHGFSARRCSACGVLYNNRASAENGPLFTPARSGDLYDEMVTKAHFEAFYSVNPNYHSIGEEPTTLLEIACGQGQLLKIAKKAGLQTFGVELNREAAEELEKKHGIPCESKVFSAATFGDRKFDVIFHRELIGRLRDPVQQLCEMKDKLNPHGQLIFETGNYADVSTARYKYLPRWADPEALHYYGESSIRELLKMAGFTRIQIISWSLRPELLLSPVLGGIRKVTKGRGIAARSRARFKYFLRYTIGALSSDRSIPRTMLVWAMK